MPHALTRNTYLRLVSQAQIAHHNIRLCELYHSFARLVPAFPTPITAVARSVVHQQQQRVEKFHYLLLLYCIFHTLCNSRSYFLLLFSASAMCIIVLLYYCPTYCPNVLLEVPFPLLLTLSLLFLFLTA